MSLPDRLLPKLRIHYIWACLSKSSSLCWEAEGLTHRVTSGMTPTTAGPTWHTRLYAWILMDSATQASSPRSPALRANLPQTDTRPKEVVCSVKKGMDPCLQISRSRCHPAWIGRKLLNHHRVSRYSRTNVEKIGRWRVATRSDGRGSSGRKAGPDSALALVMWIQGRGPRSSSLICRRGPALKKKKSMILWGHPGGAVWGNKKVALNLITAATRQYPMVRKA